MSSSKAKDLALEVRRKILDEVAGVVASPSAFSEREAFWANGKEIAHFHPDPETVLDIRLTRLEIRARRESLKANPRVALRGSSDWLEMRILSQDDVEEAVSLVAAAANAHAPPPGEDSADPPSGEALARRRRFH